MGTDLYLVWDGECVADLGRAHHYEDHDDDAENAKKRVIHDVLGHLCYQPKDHHEVLEITEEMTEAIAYLFELAEKNGKIKLLKDLKQQGFELLTDYEFERRQKIKDKPDYVVPKYRDENKDP